MKATIHRMRLRLPKEGGKSGGDRRHSPGGGQREGGPGQELSGGREGGVWQSPDPGVFMASSVGEFLSKVNSTASCSRQAVCPQAASSRHLGVRAWGIQSPGYLEYLRNQVSCVCVHVCV